MDQLLAALNKLPALPEAVRDVIASFDAPRLDSHELADKIGRDQGMSARMLRMANSPFYGLPRQVASIREAVVVLGFSSVRSLALAAGISGVFAGGDSAFSWSDYWKKCMLAGVYARSLAKCLKLDQETAFSAGLFHDIGLAVLACCAPERLAEARAKAGEGDLLAAERAVLGFDHAQLGGEVARRWNFPLVIERAIRAHHGAAAGDDPLLLVVRAAHLLALAPQGEVECLPVPLRDALGLDAERLRACLPQWEEALAASNALLGV